jgi:hypothetical protein
MTLRGLTLNLVGAFLGLVLVYGASGNSQLWPVMIALSVGLLLVVYLGPDRLGIGLVLLGMFLAPQNNIRPGMSTQVAWCDIAFALGFALLLPRILEHRGRVPGLFAGGALVLSVMTISSSIVAPRPIDSLWWGAHLLAAGVLLPLLMTFIGATGGERLRFAAAFVAGQVISTVVGLVQGSGESGRYQGTTYHPNFFAFGGILAVALTPYLFQHARDNWRYAVVGAGLLSAWSISLSGSRGALIALIAMAIVYPLMERSALSAYALLAVTFISIPLLRAVADNAGPYSAIGRILGKEKSIDGSDDARRTALSTGWERFTHSPIVGSGYSENLEIHNVPLQVAVAVGVIGLVGWLMMMAACLSPLVRLTEHRRMGYVAVAYLGMGLTEPGLWDRVAWAPLSLALLAAARMPAQDSESPEIDQPGSTSLRA